MSSFRNILRFHNFPADQNCHALLPLTNALASPSSSDHQQRFDKMASFRDHQIHLLFLLLVKFHESGKSEIYSSVQRTLQRFLPCAILSLDISRKRRPFISESDVRPNDFQTLGWLLYFKI